jgi:hypothetical protein
MKKAVYVILGFLLVGCLTLTHLSCSSSSDDGGGGTVTPAGSSQATLDETTVRDALDFIEDNVPACTMDDTTAAQKKATVRSILGLAGDISDNVILHRSAQATRTASETIAETIAGNCSPNPGSMTINLDENETTGVISGSLAFSSLCQVVDDGSGGTETLLVNGTVNISGSTNTTTGDLESLSISTGAGGITVQTGADTIAASLTSLSVSVSGSTTTITMSSLSVSANVDGETTAVTVNNLAATMTEHSDSMELDASVQYVDDDGYVDISVTDLMVDDEEQTVLGGELTVSGANGTDIKITYQSTSDDFLVEADTNGDGAYDYQPGTMDCSELDVDELLGNLPL